MSFESRCRSALALALLFVSVGCQTDCIMICRQVVLRPEEATRYNDSDWDVISTPEDDDRRGGRE
jgi:hypothetical protein